MFSESGSTYDALSYYSSSPEPPESIPASRPAAAKSPKPKTQNWSRFMKPLRQDPALTAKKPLEESVLDMAGAEFWDKQGMERSMQKLDQKKRQYIESLDRDTKYQSRLKLNLGDKLRNPQCPVQPALTERTVKTAQDVYRDTLTTSEAATRPSSRYGRKLPTIHPSGRQHGENIFPLKQLQDDKLQSSASDPGSMRPRIGTSPKKQRPEVHPPRPLTSPRRLTTPRTQAAGRMGPASTKTALSVYGSTSKGTKA